MHINESKARDIKKAPGEYLAIGSYNSQVRLKRAKLLQKIRAAHLFGLQNMQSRPQSNVLDRRNLHVLAAPNPAIRLRCDRNGVLAAHDQDLQRGQRETRGPEKYYPFIMHAVSLLHAIIHYHTSLNSL